MFTWIPLYRQLAHKVLEFENRQDELLALLRDLAGRGLQVGGLEDEDAQGNRFPLAEIDPFSFFATFNWQGWKPEKRRAILDALRDAWQLTAAVPEDFDGIPLGNPQQLWFFGWQHQREAGDIARLWEFARQIAGGNRTTVDRALFARLLKQRSIGEVKLSIGMFWLNPHEFLPADKWMRGYMERRDVPGDVWNGDTYFRWLDACIAKEGIDFPALSRTAFMEKQAPLTMPAVEKTAARRDVNFWLIQAGKKNEAWEDWKTTNDIAVGFERMEDFRAFSDKESMHARILALWPEHAGTTGQRPNVALAAWQFYREIKPGDMVFVFGGIYKLHAVARVVGDYRFDASAPSYPHRRAVKWLTVGAWTVPEELRCPQKTLTRSNDLEKYQALLQIAQLPIEEAIGQPESAASSPLRKIFTKADALDGLFTDAAHLDTILARLTRKKGIILQGPPGVGKTFVARRLAYALMRECDDSRVCMVQFHPSYGYEDFIQGYRPDGTGLKLRNGIFYEFARRAQRDERPYFFIIDEINRGNLAKIFGELLMLLEADKRGPQFALPLTYTDTMGEKFWLPKNLHLIGTMNTADRSLAMVDYALRRRFAFVTLDPALHRAEFRVWLASKGAPIALVDRIAERVGKLNGEISDEPDLGPGFRIGHSYFCPSEVPSDWEAWYRDIIDAEIAPLLEEYFDKTTRVKELTAALLAR